MGIEEQTEGDAFGNKDWTQNEDRDGFNVGEPTPFLPTINYAYFDKDDHEGDPPLAPDGEEWQDGDATGYLVEFNQAYIYNRVSESQLQQPRQQDIDNMQKIHTLDFEDDLHYFVKVQISSKNFLITEALFTGVENPYEEPVVAEGEEADPNDERPFTTQFPHIIFEEYDTGHNCYTGYYPICRIKNGHLIEYHQRDDIFVSDRQFEQRGYFVQGESAHILKTGDGEVDTSTGIGPHYKSETYPVNVRAIKAGTGVQVYQRDNYIEIHSSGGGGSGEWSGECIGYEGSTSSPLVFSKGCCVYNEYTLMPSEFHTIYGNIGPNGLSNITTSFGNPDGQAGNNDTILINSEFGLCGAEGTADHWAYKEINNGIATFRGLKAGTGVIFTNDQSDPADDSSYCVTTIHCPSGHTGWSGENIGVGVGVYKEHTLMPAQFHSLLATDNITIELLGDSINFGANYDNCTDTADWLAYKTLNAQSEAEFRGLKAGSGIVFEKDVDHATNYCVSTIHSTTGWSGENVGQQGVGVYNEHSLMPAEFHKIYGDNATSNITVALIDGGGDGDKGNDYINIDAQYNNCNNSADWKAYSGIAGGEAIFRTLNAGSGIVFNTDNDCTTTIHSTTGWSGENIGGGAEIYDEYSLMPSKFRTLTGEDNITVAVDGDNVDIRAKYINCGSADYMPYSGISSNDPKEAVFRVLDFGCGLGTTTPTDDCKVTIRTQLKNCGSAGYAPYKDCTSDYEEFHNLTVGSSDELGLSITAKAGGCGYEIQGTCCTSSDDYYISDYLIHNGDTDTKIGYPTADTIDLHTAGSARMTIKSDGKIGIGSTSPDYTLTVDGSIGGSSFGISDGKAVLIDGSPSDDQYARFTANGLEGRSASDVRSDLSLGSLATLSAVDADSVTVSNLEVDNLKASTLVTESEGIGSNDNDTTIPTSAAVKDYVDNNDGNVYVSSAAFGTSDGVLTLTRTDSATVTVDLDGRYQDEITSSSRLNANLIGSGNVSNDEFDYLDGVTSAIQTQLDAKQATISASSRLNANLIGSSGNVSNTEFDYLDGVTSAIQTQIDGKQASLTFGISNTNAVKIDSASVADDQYARFTSSGLEGRSASDVRGDLSLGSLATLSAVDADSVTVSNLEVDNFKAATIVTESEGIGSNDNDTTIPTSAAVKDYVDSNDGNVYVSSAAFGTSDGVLTLTRTDSATVTVDLDGRYQDEITSSSRLNANLIGSGNVSNTEFDYLDGVTSAIQTQLDAKQASLTFGISDGNVVKCGGSVADNDFLRIDGTEVEGLTAGEVKTALSLNNVENTAISTFSGSSNITTIGSVSSGEWNATAIADSYISSASTWNGYSTSKQDTITSGNRLNPNLIGSGNVSYAEFDYLDGVTSAIQTQLDAKQATIGDGDLTIARTSGLQTALDAKQATIDSSSRLSATLVGANGNVSNTEFGYLNGVTSAIQTQLDAKQASLTFGISDGNVVKCGGSVADNDFLRIDGTEIEGRTASQVKDDLGLGSSDDASFGSLTIDSLTHIDTDGTYGSSYGAIGIGTTNLQNGHHRIFAKSSDHMYFAAASSKGFRFRPNGGTSTASAGISINSSGYLGIGTTNASNYIDVNGGIAIGASYVGASAPSNGAIIQGNVGIGTSSNDYYPLYVNGTLYATSKYFIIDHPVPAKKKEHKKLLHACIEGPEVAVYFRGKSDLNIIKMPDYWEHLVDIESMTVELTAIGANQNIYVDSIAENGDITVGSNTEEPLNYFYVVYGERKDIDKLESEIIDPEFA